MESPSKRELEKRLERIEEIQSSYPVLPDDGSINLITEKVVYFTERGTAVGAAWCCSSYVYVPSEDTFYATTTPETGTSCAVVWSALLTCEDALGLYENPLYERDEDVIDPKAETVDWDTVDLEDVPNNPYAELDE